MGIGAFYGLIVALVVGMVWLSRDHVCQKLGLLLLTAWASTNLVVNYFGFEQAAMINPSIDALMAGTIATIGFKSRSRLALGVFLLYVVVGAAWVLAWVWHEQVSRALYDVLGVLFLMQLSVVGATGGRLALRHWLSSRRPRLHPHPVGG